MKKKEIGEILESIGSTAFRMHGAVSGDAPESVTPGAVRLASIDMSQAFAVCATLCGIGPEGDDADKLGDAIRERGDVDILTFLLKASIEKLAEEQR